MEIMRGTQSLWMKMQNAELHFKGATVIMQPLAARLP